MHLDDPIDKNASHFFINVNLLFHIVVSGHIITLFYLHVVNDVPNILGTLLRIIFVSPIDLLYILSFDLVHCD